MPNMLSENQLRDLELANPEGMSSLELVAAFQDNRVRFSEATLRKYVQLGLVPRSRRVGQKGKHLGSRGVYPVRALRRINTIKRLMAERFTIEEIQARFLVFKDRIETLEEALEQTLRLFETKFEEQAPSELRTRLRSELDDLRASADGLMEAVGRLDKLFTKIVAPPRPRGGGAASPTELL